MHNSASLHYDYEHEYEYEYACKYELEYEYEYVLITGCWLPLTGDCWLLAAVGRLVLLMIAHPLTHAHLLLHLLSSQPTLSSERGWSW